MSAQSADLVPSRGPRARPVALLAALTAAFLLFLVAVAFLMNRFSIEIALAAAACLAFGVFCFIRPHWVLYLIVFASLFSPEFIASEALGRAAKRPVTIRIEDVLLLVITLSWLARAAVHKELGLMLRTPLNKPIFLYLFACVLATAVGFIEGWVAEPLAAALFVLKYVEYFVLFFMVVNHVETPRHMGYLVAAGVLTYVAVCVYGFLQIPEGGRPTTPGEFLHSEPNTLAGYLLFMIGLCAGLLLFARSFFGRLLWGGLCLGGGVLLAYTLSRSGWAGLIGILLVLVFIGRHRLVVLGSLLALAGFLALVSFRVDWLPETVAQRVHETAGDFVPLPWAPPVVIMGHPLDPSASERYRSYEAALTTWAARSAERGVPLLTGSGILGGRPFVDGQYVRVLAETGLLGLAAFVLLLATIGRHVWRSYYELRLPWHRGLALGYLAGFAGLVIHALGANTFIIVRIMEPFFIFTGIVVLLPALERQAEAPPAPAVRS